MRHAYAVRLALGIKRSTADFGAYCHSLMAATGGRKCRMGFNSVPDAGGFAWKLLSMGEESSSQVYIQLRIAVTSDRGCAASWFFKLGKPRLVPRVTNVLY